MVVAPSSLLIYGSDPVESNGGQVELQLRSMWTGQSETDLVLFGTPIGQTASRAFLHSQMNVKDSSVKLDSNPLGTRSKGQRGGAYGCCFTLQ